MTRLPPGTGLRPRLTRSARSCRRATPRPGRRRRVPRARLWKAAAAAAASDRSRRRIRVPSPASVSSAVKDRQPDAASMARARRVSRGIAEIQGRGEPTVGEDQDTLHAGGDLRRMRDDDEARAELAVELEHQLEHATRVPPVEIAGRLVGEHEPAAASPARARLPRAGARRPRAAPDGACSRASRPTRSSNSRACCGRRSRRHAPHQQRHRHVLERGELRQQVVELVDETECLVAQPPALGVGELVDAACRRCGRVRSTAGRARPGSAAASSCRNPRRRRSPRVSPAPTAQVDALAAPRDAGQRPRNACARRRRSALRVSHGAGPSRDRSGPRARPG